MAKIVDARGLTCPQPVILTKKAMEESGLEEITTIVDNSTALENVTRLAKSQNYDLRVEERTGIFHIHMRRTGLAEEEPLDNPADVAILIASNLFGQGAEELGQVLMKSFLYTLTQMQPPVKNLMFMNSGVFLTTEGSPLLEQLAVLEGQGVEILSCGTCLDYYELKDKLVVGKVTNMYTIMENLTTASRSLTF
jgi:selenium metabolism protein YedF